jgi:ABC-type Fe3+-siderophore transport system permease subunit
MGRIKVYEEEEEGGCNNFDALLPVCTWGPHEPLISRGISDQYIFSLYWSVLVLMTGGTPHDAQSSGDAIITIAMILMGVLLNACLISVLGVLIIDADSLANQRAKKIVSHTVQNSKACSVLTLYFCMCANPIGCCRQIP